MLPIDVAQVSRNHWDELVCRGETGEKEKQNGLCTMKGGRNGDVRVERTPSEKPELRPW